MSIDLFGRLRTSEPKTIFDYYSTPESAVSLDNSLWVNIKSGNGNISYNSANYVDLSVLSDGDYALRYTKQPMEYQPGKTRLTYMTGVLLSNPLGSNVITARAGLFNVNSADNMTVTDGVYYQTDGINLQWGETTQLGTTIVNQSDWNIDKFDGNGSSGKTLTIDDAGRNFLIVFSGEWLGVGVIRTGFYIDGILYYAHQFSHNLMSVQYTSTPRQRICHQIIGTSVTSPNSSRQMCCTHISEGGFLPLGKRNSIHTNTSGIILANAKTKYILLALKIKDIYPNGIIKMLRLSGGYSAGKMGFIELQLHSSVGNIGAIDGMLSYTDLSDSIAQYSFGTGTQTIVTDGYPLTSFFVASQSSFNFAQNDFETLLKKTICTQYDTLYLIGVGSSTGDLMFATMDFIESL